ncbi:putative quinol monooxygenase [Legionella gresilensis]|uniref:putative quinol monooxygenase n=1 Tax=Legionella gresilensis TaxID=91823 RepID=UPI001F5F7D67|nr:hypothetical protein [Legionella gresilensis]
MKIKLLTFWMFIWGLITMTYASEKIMINAETIHKATFIKMKSQQGSTSSFLQFLKRGAQLVHETEPNTALWFALQEDNQLGIFDIFFNEKGREQHFAGQVAHALKQNATQLVLGGWEKGVLQNINNYDLIASNNFNKDTVLTAKEASYITFQAKPGKNRELEILLTKGSQLINQTEPGTYLWVALKNSQNTYAIFDVFPDKAAQKAHFSGKVAEELRKNAKKLIVGGWEKGVITNVHQFRIIALT